MSKAHTPSLNQPQPHHQRRSEPTPYAASPLFSAAPANRAGDANTRANEPTTLRTPLATSPRKPNSRASGVCAARGSSTAPATASASRARSAGPSVRPREPRRAAAAFFGAGVRPAEARRPAGFVAGGDALEKAGGASGRNDRSSDTGTCAAGKASSTGPQVGAVAG